MFKVLLMSVTLALALPIPLTYRATCGSELLTKIRVRKFASIASQRDLGGLGITIQRCPSPNAPVFFSASMKRKTKGPLSVRFWMG